MYDTSYGVCGTELYGTLSAIIEVNQFILIIPH